MFIIFWYPLEYHHIKTLRKIQAAEVGLILLIPVTDQKISTAVHFVYSFETLGNTASNERDLERPHAALLPSLLSIIPC